MTVQAAITDATERACSPGGAAHPFDAVRTGLIGLGVYELGVAAFLAASGALGNVVGSSAPRSDHRLVDLAAFELPLGVGSLAAVRLQSWRAPVLALGSLNWTLRALTRLHGVRSTDRRWLDVVDRATSAVGAGALAWLFSRALRAERWATR